VWFYLHGFTVTRGDQERPLTPGEKENRPSRFRQSRAPRLVAAQDAVFPLPGGEGQGEGERDAGNQNGWTNFASSTPPAPRLRVHNHIERKPCRWSKRARSQAHRCFERCFPLTPALSLGERVDTGPTPEDSAAVAIRSPAAGDETAAIQCMAIALDRWVRRTPALSPSLPPMGRG